MNSLLVFLLFLLQFVYLPVGMSFFEVPKVYAVEIGVFLLLLYSIFGKEYWSWKTHRVFFVLLCLLFVLSVFHLIFHQQGNTFWGNPFRMQGTLLLWFFLVFAWLSSFMYLRRIPVWFLVGALLLQVFWTFWIHSGSLSRAVGSLGEPNSLAGEMVFLWPFVFETIELRMKMCELGKRVKLLFLLCFVLCSVMVVIFVSGSRSGLVAFLLQVVLLGLVKLRVRLHWAVVACFIFLFLSYSLPFFEQSGLYENRGEVWQSALLAGWRYPILGFGFGNVEYALHSENLRLGNHLQGYYVDSSHNVFLDWFVEGGVVGLGLFTILVARSIFEFVRRKELLYLLLLFGLLGVLSFNPVSVVLLVAFWWAIGQGWRFQESK